MSNPRSKRLLSKNGFSTHALCTVVYSLRSSSEQALTVTASTVLDACSPRPPVRQAAVTVDEGDQGEQGEGQEHEQKPLFH